ncbi:MAG: tetratricopeptide repeat protein [Planctomycetota bacterium]|jgi:hypothetical protein
MFWPFKRKKKKETTTNDTDDKLDVEVVLTPGEPSSTKDVERSDDWLRIKSIDFFGQFSTSPNGRYTLGWREGTPASEPDGTLKRTQGSYVLLDGDEIMLQGKMQRPNDGKVANNGTFILNDWMLHTKTNGTFYAFDVQGNILIKHLFQANLFNNGLSPDGKYAICQTANTLNFFDLSTGEHLWQKKPAGYLADSYEFDLEKELIYAVDKNLGKFAYSFSGEFLDTKQQYTARIENAIRQSDGSSLAFRAREHFQNLGEKIDTDTAKEILSLLEKALQLGLDGYANEEAMVYRTVGEVHEALDEKLKAIESYEKALELNPKVGVKRRLNALKKDTE